MSVECRVYRCARQAEMYLYVRADLATDTLPDALRAHTGRLTEVMTLALTPQRKLARVDVARVIEQLRDTGYYLQMPPAQTIDAHLYFGD
jgi:uncharacterized protein YcgL (UPF0745 family)